MALVDDFRSQDGLVGLAGWLSGSGFKGIAVRYGFFVWLPPRTALLSLFLIWASRLYHLVKNGGGGRLLLPRSFITATCLAYLPGDLT